MQIRVETELLRNALNKILSVVDKKNSRPILTYAQIAAKNDQIHISATDLEVSTKIGIQCEIESSGTFCVNAKNLFDILRELPNTVIHLVLEDCENSLKLNCHDIHYSLLIYKSDDFPKLIFENKDNSFHIPSNQLLEIVNKTAHSILSDETRPHLNGIFLQEMDSKLRAVSTDGHRLGLIEIPLSRTNIEPLNNGIIIPKKGVFELKKLAESYPDAELLFSVDDSFLYVSAKNEYFLSVRLISREYPKYQAVIPSKTLYTLTVDRDVFFNAIRRIKIMSNEKSNGVRLNINEKEMTITANHPSLGNAKETIPVDYNGKEITIGFNAKYLVETLSTFEQGEIYIELNNELSPVIIKSATTLNFLGIIMPLKL